MIADTLGKNDQLCDLSLIMFTLPILNCKHAIEFLFSGKIILNNNKYKPWKLEQGNCAVYVFTLIISSGFLDLICIPYPCRPFKNG